MAEVYSGGSTAVLPELTSTQERKIKLRPGNRGLYRVLKQRVNAYFEESGRSRSADWRLWVKGAVFAALAAIAYAAILWNGSSAWQKLGLAILYVLSVLPLAINVAHDSAHDALTRLASFNRVAQKLIFTETYRPDVRQASRGTMRCASRIAAWSLALTIPSVLGACVAIAVPPPSDDLRRAMPGMEVKVVYAPPAKAPDAPVAGAGAGAAKGALHEAGEMLGRSVSSGEGGILLLPLVPVAAVVGAVVGSVKAHGKEDVAAAETHLRDAVAALDAVQGLRDALTAADSRPGARVTPASAEQPVWLEVTVLGYGLASEGTYEPDVHLFLSVSGRVLRGEDGEELYWRLWSYRGPESPYFSLAAEAPDSVRRMAEVAYRVVAERVLHDLFDTSVDEPFPNENRPVATVAAKYMRRNSELREYEMSEVLGHRELWLFSLNAGRPARAQKTVAESQAPQGQEPSNPPAASMSTAPPAAPQSEAEALRTYRCVWNAQEYHYQCSGFKWWF